MVARSGVVFPATMADILANPVQICFGSFTATSTALAATTSPSTADVVQGIERIIDMMDETLQICERAQRSTQTAL
jgi:hypothetical protein